MVRKKNMPIADQILDTEKEIEVAEQKLKELKDKRKGLLEQKKQEDLEEIYRLMKESGTSVDELKQILSK